MEAVRCFDDEGMRLVVKRVARSYLQSASQGGIFKAHLIEGLNEVIGRRLVADEGDDFVDLFIADVGALGADES